MANSTTMTYGAYNFTPVPLMSIQKEYQRSDDQTIVGSLITVTLNGTLTPLPSVGGLDVTMALQDEVRSAFNGDGRFFEVKCDSTTVFSGCPRIRSIKFDESVDNWVLTIPFTIELEFDLEITLSEDKIVVHPPYIETASEEWNIEFVEDHKNYNLDLSTITDQQAGSYYGNDNNQLYMMRVTHNVSAKGKRHFTCSITGTGGSLDMPAWEQARDYVIPLLGFNWNVTQSSGVLNLPTGTGNVFDHFRTNQVGILDGTFAVTESWLVMPSSLNGSGNDRATEDFSITVREGVENDLTNVSIEGSIQGLETRDYGSGPDTYDLVERAYDAASNYWNFVQPRVFSRVQYMGEADATRTFNPVPVTKSLGHNPSKGTITYNYEYDDRPCNFISGSISEDFTIADNYPTDVFARLPVLGRARGPVLQAISTVTEQTREITIEVVMPPPTGCSNISDLNLNKPTGQIATLLCSFETELTNNYEQVFKHADSENWNPRQGRYSRSVGWTFQNCTSGDAPNSSFC